MGHYAKRFFGKKIEEPRDPDFVFTIDSFSKQFKFNFNSGYKDCTVYWGDGTSDYITVGTSYGARHTYAADGVYQIRIVGPFSGIFNETTWMKRVVSLDQWGTNEFTIMASMFNDAQSMVANYTDSPNTSNVARMDKMFLNCTKFNGAVEFDTSNVTDMQDMFRNCYEFNQKVDFNSQNVTTMRGMFSGCSKFNGEVNFDTQNVTSMSSMFYKCSEFNQEVDFNSQNVTSMAWMFRECTKLTVPVKLDTSSVTTIEYMFYNSPLIQQSFASWDVTSLTAGNGFIRLADINEPGNTDNYDNTLISWASQDIPRPDIELNIGFGASKYSSRAKSARDFLVTNKWKISDGGMI